MTDSKNKPVIFYKGIAIAVMMAVVLVMLIFPLPTILLDILIALNLIQALLILIAVRYCKNPRAFSSLPTVLLMSTLFGLALNVSSTRLILTQGAAFSGRLIGAIASFVMGAGLVVSFVIFVLIAATVIFVKGAVRTAEVAARFVLDALPGKQMDIEAEYDSGAISEEEFLVRKNDLEREVDFYGALDGAFRFIAGSVKMGILITAVNILGGIIIGTQVHGEPFNDACKTYIPFAIGDGLLFLFPVILFSAAIGITVSRSLAGSAEPKS